MNIRAHIARAQLKLFERRNVNTANVRSILKQLSKCKRKEETPPVIFEMCKPPRWQKIYSHHLRNNNNKKLVSLYAGLNVWIGQTSARALFVKFIYDLIKGTYLRIVSSLEKMFETFLYISNYEYLLITLRDLTT